MPGPAKKATPAAKSSSLSDLLGKSNDNQPVEPVENKEDSQPDNSDNSGKSVDSQFTDQNVDTSAAKPGFEVIKMDSDGRPVKVDAPESKQPNPDMSKDFPDDDSDEVSKGAFLDAHPVIDHKNYDLSGNGVTDNLPVSYIEDYPSRHQNINVPSENAVAIRTVRESVYAAENEHDDKGITAANVNDPNYTETNLALGNTENDGDVEEIENEKNDKDKVSG